METIKIQCKGQTVTAELDTTPMYRQLVTLRFDNGDYADISVKHHYNFAWYLTTQLNVDAVHAFIDNLKNGKTTISKVS